MSCGTFAVQLGAHGFGETATATDEFLDQSRGQAYVQLVYQFSRPGTASTFFAGLRTTTIRCRSFTAPAFGVSTRWTQQVSTAAPVSGQQAMQILQTARASGTTTKTGYLFVLDGTDVYGTIRVGLETGTAPPAEPQASAIITKLITRIQALG